MTIPPTTAIKGDRDSSTALRFGIALFGFSFIRAIVADGSCGNEISQGVEIEGVYEAASGIHPPRYWLYAFALQQGQRSHTVGMRWAPTEKGAKAMIASLARTIHP